MAARVLPGEEGAVVKLTPLLVAAGIFLAVGGAAWYLLGRPDETDTITARTVCVMNGAARCQMPVAPVAGPIVLAAVGAFLILIGAVLSPRRTTP
jgi:hypothetical protein